MASILEQLAAELAQTKYKHDNHTPLGTPSTPYYTGPGGLFGVAGLERDVISTRIMPRGIASAIPARASNMVWPFFPYITGFLAESGSNPTNVCDDPMTAGPGKSCIQTAAFGRYSFQTRELELNRIGQQINRGEFQDLRIINPPLLEAQSIITPMVGGNPSFVQEALMRFTEVGITFQNKLMRQVYIGNPANNSAGGGYSEFPGLDILISTNKVDAITGGTCPSLNSDVKDFNYVQVTNNAGADIIATLGAMMRYLSWNADRMNLNPVSWVFTMRPHLFWELTAVWPCAYMFARCTPGITNGQVVSIDASDQIAMRDAMRQGRYLLIDGVQYPVVLDDAIVEESSGDNNHIVNGCFASDIYIIPMTFGGGYAGTFWEYYNYQNGPTDPIANGYQNEFWTDGGMYLWHAKPPMNWCVNWIAKIEPRIILRVPQLAGRLQNVQYCNVIQHVREPFPTDPYFVDGGVSTGYTATQPYSDWHTRQ